VTAGDTGDSGVHVTFGSATVNVAVVAFTRFHPGGSVAGHDTPVAARVAVAVTSWAGDGGYVPAGLPGGLSEYVMLVVVASVTRCVVVAPFTHCANATVGATGVTCVHDVPTRLTVNVAVTGPVWVHPAGICPQANPPANVAVTVTVVFAVPL
jgi:hypothetical protein